MNIIRALVKRILFKRRGRDTILVTHKYRDGHTESRLVSLKKWMKDTEVAFAEGLPVGHELPYD